MLPAHKQIASDHSPIIVTPAMLQEGADILLFFDPEMSDHKEYAEKIYRAMVEVSHSDP